MLAIGNILLLAGDIVPLKLIDKRQDFFSFIADNYRQTYWVPGNHEYYNSDLANRTGAFCEAIRPNVTLLNNTSIRLKNCRLHFTTLWSNIHASNAWHIERGLMDFHAIRFEGRRLSVQQYNRMHAGSVAYLHNCFHEKPNDSQGEKNIIITHHVPTFLNYPAEYAGSPLNDAFATNLDHLITAFGADYWVYGHNHASIGDFTLGKTQLVTNQLDYVRHHEHGAFNTARVINLDD